MEDTDNAGGIVSKSAKETSAKFAKNFPSEICKAPTGLVNRLSIVPDRLSSDQVRILMAATKKMSKTGVHLNKGFKSAMLRAKKASAQKKMNKVASK